MRAIVAPSGIAVVVAILIAGTTPAAADRATAEKHFRAGAKAYAAQNFAAAAANFDQAYVAEEIPEIAFSAAQAYRRLYRIEPQIAHVERAITLYRAYLAKVKTGGRVGDAVDNLADMERELDKLQRAGASSSGVATTPRTRIGVSVTLADQRGGETSALREIGDVTGEVTRGLAITIDGAAVEPFALIELKAKEHVITANADGYFPVEKKVIAVEGQSSLIDVELRPRPATIVVTTEAGARISIDGRAVATAPTGAVELAAGTYWMTVLRRGRKPFVRELVVGRGQRLVVGAPLDKTARRRAVPWVLGGAGVFAAGAILSGLAASSHDGTASDLRAQLDAGNRPIDDVDRYDQAVTRRDQAVTATWIFGGTAVTAGVVGTLLYLLDTPTAEGLRVGPTVTPGAGGVAVHGRF